MTLNNFYQVFLPEITLPTALATTTMRCCGWSNAAVHPLHNSAFLSSDCVSLLDVASLL
jgi:hypothetical protein